MLATGVRIGESLAVLGHQVNFATSEVEITHQIIRVKEQGLIRIRTKSRAGERVLKVPAWGMAMLRTRLMNGGRLDEPVFANADGGLPRPRQRSAGSEGGAVAGRQSDAPGTRTAA